MNYYNPYFVPYSNIVPPKTGLFTKLLGGKSLNLSSILSGTGKVINFLRVCLQKGYIFSFLYGIMVQIIL